MATMAIGLGQVHARPRFYGGMAAIFVLIAFGGFIPTYWAKLVGGSFDAPPIIHIHGALFFIWTLYYFTQTALVSAGRTLDHRRWGLAGISLATAMSIAVVLAVISGFRLADAQGYGEASRRFSAVSLLSLPLFIGFFTAAIVKVRQAEWHKRLMILAMIPLMHAAIGRVFQTILQPPGSIGPAPVFVTILPGLTADLLIVVAMVYDWRTRGAPHPAYIIGLPILAGTQLLLVAVAATPGWLIFTNAIARLMG